MGRAWYLRVGIGCCFLVPKPGLGNEEKVVLQKRAA